MKKMLISLFLLIAASAFGQTDNAECRKFRSGSFYYVNETGDTVHITRNGRRQQERNMKTKVLTKFRMNWTSDCSYELLQTWSNSRKMREYNGTVTRITMTVRNGSSYNYTCACKDVPGKSNSGIIFRR